MSDNHAAKLPVGAQAFTYSQQAGTSCSAVKVISTAVILKSGVPKPPQGGWRVNTSTLSMCTTVLFSLEEGWACGATSRNYKQIVRVPQQWRPGNKTCARNKHKQSRWVIACLPNQEGACTQSAHVALCSAAGKQAATLGLLLLLYQLLSLVL